MRWLLIGFLVSLGALLLAAAGVAHHIWLRRRKPGGKTPSSDRVVIDEKDLESEP